MAEVKAEAVKKKPATPKADIPAKESSLNDMNIAARKQAENLLKEK